MSCSSARVGRALLLFLGLDSSSRSVLDQQGGETPYEAGRDLALGIVPAALTRRNSSPAFSS